MLQAWCPTLMFPANAAPINRGDVRRMRHWKSIEDGDWQVKKSSGAGLFRTRPFPAVETPKKESEK